MIAPVMAIAKRRHPRRHPRLSNVLADGGYQGEATAAAVREAADLPFDIVKRSDKPGFVVLPKRWIVERTFGWFGRGRRLTKDYENLHRTGAAFLIMAMIRLMLRRVTRMLT